MKRLLISTAIALALADGLFAQTAVVKEFTGKSRSRQPQARGSRPGSE